MKTAHAEIGGLYQAYKAGLTKGKHIDMFIEGDIPKMLDATKVASATIYDLHKGRVYYWNPSVNSLYVKD